MKRENTSSKPKRIKAPEELALPREGFARPCQVAHAFGISRATLYNRVASGSFPQPQKDGSRISKWPVSLVREYLAAQGGTVNAFPQESQGNQPTPAS